MNIRKYVHRPRKKAFQETDFWKQELTLLLQKFYPRTWKEELWKAELRKIEASSKGG